MLKTSTNDMQSTYKHETLYARPHAQKSVVRKRIATDKTTTTGNRREEKNKKKKIERKKTR